MADAAELTLKLLKLGSRRFLSFTLMKAHPNLVKLRLAHDARQAEQQTIVISARIVEPFADRKAHV